MDLNGGIDAGIGESGGTQVDEMSAGKINHLCTNAPGTELAGEPSHRVTGGRPNRSGAVASTPEPYCIGEVRAHAVTKSSRMALAFSLK